MKEKDLNKIRKNYKDILPVDVNEILEDDIREIVEKGKNDKKSIKSSFSNIKIEKPNFVFDIV